MFKKKELLLYTFFVAIYLILHIRFIFISMINPIIGYLVISLFKTNNNNNITTVPKLFFGIITVENSAYRRNFSYNFWIKDILLQGHDYIFTTEKPIEPSYKWTELKDWSRSPPPKNPTKKFISNRDRENKRLTLANYFLQQTTADFFINPTDDVFVDSKRINTFAITLGKKYNTEYDFILLGNCISKGEFSFIQGGSGYIMTRAMAREFISYSERWLRESSGPDDFEMSRFLSYLKKFPRDATSPFMCGHNLHELKRKNIDIRKLPLCPNYYDSVCNQGVAKLEDLFFIHPIYSSFESGFIVWENFQRMINDKDHHYGWYNTFYTHVCRFD